MKKVFCILLVVICLINYVDAQSYKKVKVTLKNGLVVKGDKALIADESITFTTDNQLKTFPLSDVTLVQAKKGSADKWALGCGGGCLAVNVIYGVSNGFTGVDMYGNETTAGSFILGAILETAVGAGIGYLIGSITDKEEIVYIKNSALLNNFKLNFSTDQLTKDSPKFNKITLAYRF